jgi:hypothetical protein
MMINILIYILVGTLIPIISGTYLIIDSLYGYHIKNVADSISPTSFKSLCFIFLIGFSFPLLYVILLINKLRGK